MVRFHSPQVPKKIILFLCALFLLLILLIPFKVSVADEYTAERWKSDSGAEYEVQRSGDQITFTRVKIRSGAPQRVIGTVALTGTISGTTFTGTTHNFTDECPPDLDTSTPASGTVSADGNSIAINFNAMLYDPETCQDSGKTSPHSATFTRISSPSLTPISNNAQGVGKTGTISGGVDKPEVLNPQKLSPLAVVGLVLLAIVSSVVFFLKKKGKKTKFSKKKR